MRRTSSKRLAVAASALAAAGWSAFAGAPAARGDFIVSDYNIGVQSYGGNSWQVWVLAATNNAANGTGSTLAALQVTVDTGGTFMAIDVESAGGTGTNSKYSANVNGSVFDSSGVNATLQNQAAPPLFGDVVGGTFIGVGTGTFSTDIANHPVVTQDGFYAITPGGSAGGTGVVHANGQQVNFIGIKASNSPFANPGPPPFFNVGNIDNGVVHSLGLDVVSRDGSGNVVYVPDGPGNGPVPFINVVVPVGTSFTVSGNLEGEGAAGLFAVTLPEPASVALLAFGGSLLVRRKSRAKRDRNRIE